MRVSVRYSGFQLWTVVMNRRSFYGLPFHEDGERAFHIHYHNCSPYKLMDPTAAIDEFQDDDASVSNSMFPGDGQVPR